MSVKTVGKKLSFMFPMLNLVGRLAKAFADADCCRIRLIPRLCGSGCYYLPYFLSRIFKFVHLLTLFHFTLTRSVDLFPGIYLML